MIGDDDLGAEFTGELNDGAFGSIKTHQQSAVMPFQFGVQFYHCVMDEFNPAVGLDAVSPGN